MWLSEYFWIEAKWIVQKWIHTRDWTCELLFLKRSSDLKDLRKHKFCQTLELPWTQWTPSWHLNTKPSQRWQSPAINEWLQEKVENFPQEREDKKKKSIHDGGWWNYRFQLSHAHRPVCLRDETERWSSSLVLKNGGTPGAAGSSNKTAGSTQRKHVGTGNVGLDADYKKLNECSGYRYIQILHPNNKKDPKNAC